MPKINPFTIMGWVFAGAAKAGGLVFTDILPKLLKLGYSDE